MPDRLPLPLAGPTFERALLLARRGVTDGIIGGPGLEAGLEPILTEAVNDRQLAPLLTFLLLGFASQAAVVAAAGELGGAAADEGAVAERAVELVDALADAFRQPGSAA